MLLGCALVASAVAASRNAHACGVGAGGASGVSACSLEEHAEQTRLKYRVGASYAFTSTTLHFSGFHADQQRHGLFATLDYRLTNALTLELALGAFAGGTLALPTEHHAMNAGPATAIAASWRVVDADGLRPFVLLTGQIAAVTTTTTRNDVPSTGTTGYTALDLRVGAVAGIPIAHTVTPYLVARAFGGPIAWRIDGAAVTGTDAYHVQLGAGVSVLLFRRVDLFVEGVPLGERGVATGLGVAL